MRYSLGWGAFYAVLLSWYRRRAHVLCGWGGGGEAHMKTYYASTRSTKYVNLRNETLKQIMTEEGAWVVKFE